MFTLDLALGGSVAVTTVAMGTSLQKLVSSQVKASGREDCEDPFYLVDLGRLLTLWDRWHQSMPLVQPFYAVKCNTDPAILQTLAALGCGFDCASKTEIKLILDLGVSPDRIIYANPCKQASHLKYAAKTGVSTMTFDNEVELHKVKTHYPTARLVLRIRADDPSALCQLGIKFGCTVDEGKRLLLRARGMNLLVCGVSFHVGSNSKNPQCFLSALKMAHQMFVFGESLGYHFTLLDIGGGFPGTKDSSGFFSHLAGVIKDGFGQYFSGRPDLKIIAEPGRYFACSTHTLTVSVISKRQREPSSSSSTSFMYYINDGVYGSFNCILYDHITPTPAVVKARPPSSLLYPSSVWGPTCDGADKICEVSLPELHAGEWLYFEDMGAYTVCAASNFNGFHRPKNYYYVMEDTSRRFQQLCEQSHSTGVSYLPLPPPSPSPVSVEEPHQSVETPIQELVKVY